jgi:hypothetical protein
MEIVCHTARRSHCYGLNRCVHCLVGLPRWSCFEPIARTIKQASGAPLSAAVQGSAKRRSHIADHLNCGPPRRRKIPLARDRHRDRECSLRTAGHTRHVLMSSRTAPSKRASHKAGRCQFRRLPTPSLQFSPWLLEPTASLPANWPRRWHVARITRFCAQRLGGSAPRPGMGSGVCEYP